MPPGQAAAQMRADDVITMRVVPGWTRADGRRYAALHLRLAPGWKTYWRLPGAGGIAPVFDWSGSDNVSGIGVHWPHPEIFTDYGLRTVGYADEVYLPLTVMPADPSTPVRLTAHASLGVCREICLPVSKIITATLPAAAAPPPRDGAGVRAALASAAHARRGAGHAVCRVAPIADGLSIALTISGTPPLGGVEMVFIRPGRDDIWVSEPEITANGETVTARADLVPPEGKPFALDRSALSFTLLGPDGSADLTGCEAG